MARIARRRVLALSASGGMAAILASGRAPALAQETSVHWLRWADFVPASDVLLKGPITQECKKATRDHAQGRDRQRQRPAVAHHLGDPVGRRRGHHHGGSATGRSSTAGAWPTSATWPRSSARPGAATTTSRGRSRTIGNKWIGVPLTIGGGLIAYRKSWLEEAGYNDLPRNLGDLPRGRQEAEGQGAADRPDRGPHVRRRAGLVVSLSCGRSAARKSRPTARPSC